MRGSGRGWMIVLAAVGLILPGLAFLYFVPTQTEVDGADAGNPAQVAQGAQVYAEHCASCHGARLEGQPDWRTPLASGGYPAPPHDATGHTWHHADGMLFEMTRLGGKEFSGGAFKSNMPGFGAILSDSDIWAVLAFIKSRWPENIRRRQTEMSRRYEAQREN